MNKKLDKVHPHLVLRHAAVVGLKVLVRVRRVVFPIVCHKGFEPEAHTPHCRFKFCGKFVP